jgi:hypothetical protein
MMNVIVADYIPIAGTHTATTLSAGAVTLTVDASADSVIVQALTSGILFTVDGTTPDAGSSPVVGFRLSAYDPPVRIPYHDGMTIKVIREAAGSVLQKVDARNRG